jgi:tetratricopeptide (TPR) repeat protein
LGDLYFDTGEYERAKDCYRRGLSILKPSRILPSLINTFEVAVTRTKALTGDQDIDLRELFTYYEENRFRLFKAYMARYIGEILLNLGEKYFTEAEEWVKRAIAADKKNGMMFFVGKDYALYAELLKRKGATSKAKENLNKGIDIFRECGAEGWVEKSEGQMQATT